MISYFLIKHYFLLVMGGTCIHSISIKNNEVQVFYQGNISLLVRCRKQIAGERKLNILIEHPALILFYSWLFFSVPTKMFILTYCC